MISKVLSRRPVSVAWIIGAVFVLLMLVLAAAAGISIWNSYNNALERARVRVTTAAQVVSTHVEWQIAASLRVLHDADRLLGANPASIDKSTGLELRTLLQFLPDGMQVMIVDETGRVRFSTSPKSHDLKPEDSQAINKLSGETAWYISPAETSGPPEERNFLIAKRIERDGRTVGGVVLSVPSITIINLWASLDLGPDSTVGLLRDDGWLIARYPMPDQPVNLANYVLFTEYLKNSTAGVYDAESPVDNTVRIVSYRTVRNGPLVVTASTSRTNAVERVWRQAFDLLLLLVPLIFSLAVLAIWVIRLLQHDERLRVGLSEAMERNKLLMREIHHRVKNNLQSVASLVKLQPVSDEAKKAMSDRIAAMSAVHEQAYRSDQYDVTNLGEYLSLLIDNIARSASPGIKVSKLLQNVTIDRDLAQPLGLVVNEVISNALKHAFSGRDSGSIDVRLGMLSPGRAELVIRDDGPGYEGSGNGTGMGSRLIRAFAQQLGDDFTYSRDNGTVFTIRFPARIPEGM